MLGNLHRLYGRFLEAIVIVLITTLAILVVAGFTFRRLGASLGWYDEVAALLLCWLTFYGAALAALRRAHMSVPGMVLAMPVRLRIAVAIFGEIVTLGFFVVLAWSALKVLSILGGAGLASLPWVSVQVVQSAIPAGALLFIISQLLSAPDMFRSVIHGKTDEGKH